MRGNSRGTYYVSDGDPVLEQSLAKLGRLLGENGRHDPPSQLVVAFSELHHSRTVAIANPVSTVVQWK